MRSIANHKSGALRRGDTNVGFRLRLYPTGLTVILSSRSFAGSIVIRDDSGGIFGEDGFVKPRSSPPTSSVLRKTEFSAFGQA
jgi:hypothetical protein